MRVQLKAQAQPQDAQPTTTQSENVSEDILPNPSDKSLNTLQSNWVQLGLVPGKFMTILNSTGDQYLQAVVDEKGNIVIVPMFVSFNQEWDAATSFKSWEEAQDKVDQLFGQGTWSVSTPQPSVEKGAALHNLELTSNVLNALLS